MLIGTMGIASLNPSYGLSLLTPHLIVGGFFDDLHVVHVRFARAGGGDFDKFGSGVNFLDSGAAEIHHSRSQSPHELLDHRGDAALIRHPSLDTFRNEFVSFAARSLKIAVARSLLHRAE
jgi:hypothetical protein